MDQREFRDISGTFATGVTIMTTKNEFGQPVGMTANSFTSLSLSPPLVIFNIDKKVSLFNVFINAGQFAVNILEEQQEHLCKHFAKTNINRFEGVKYKEGITGAPILYDTLGYLDCVVKEYYEGGDHYIIIGEAKGGKQSKGNPLLFYKGKFKRLKLDRNNRFENMHIN